MRSRLHSPRFVIFRVRLVVCQLQRDSIGCFPRLWTSDPQVHVFCPRSCTKPPPWRQIQVPCHKPAVFRETTFDQSSVNFDKVCDKVSGNGRFRWNLSSHEISEAHEPAGYLSCDTSFLLEDGMRRPHLG